VANSLIVYLMDFVIAIAAVIMPMTTRLRTEGDWPKLREIFLKWSKVALSLTVIGRPLSHRPRSEVPRVVDRSVV
jgi:O-antigen/teichoic acid export membrane protein